MPTLRAARPSTSYDAARRSASDSPAASVGCTQDLDLGGSERRDHVGVRPEGLHALAQDEVVAHAGARRVPDPVHRLGPRVA